MPPTTTTVVLVTVLFGLASSLPAKNSTLPAKIPDKVGRTFLFDGFTKGFTISRVTDDNQVQQTNSAMQNVRFVPLITLLAGMLPNLLTRLGQFTGVNRVTTNNRRFAVADKPHENSIDAPPPLDDQEEGGGEEGEDEDEEEDDYQEKELIECDGHHLGLWPDKTNSQRYYKCEVDPRTTPTAACIREMMDKSTGKEMLALEKIEVPGVKPCYLLTMLKCANGYKYQHSTRICVPDIVFTSKQ